MERAPPPPTANASKTAGRAISVCFTLNNYTPEEVHAIRHDDASYKWLCYGEEVGANGTPHLQGAFSVSGNQAIAYSSMHKFPGMARAHFIKSMGTCQQNIDYCFKGDLSHSDYMTGGKRLHPQWGRNAVTYFKGTPPEPGKSHKLRDAANQIISGSKVADLAQTEEYASTCAQYTRGLLYVESCNVPARIGPPKVFWLYGSTGTGKTRCAVEFGKLDGSYWKSGGNSTVGSGLRWFDGYSGQRVAILDDFRPKGCRFDFLLQLLDRYPFRVEFKTGSIEWVPQYIFITTPKSISKTFENRKKHIPEDIGQLRRRITDNGRSFRFGKGLGMWTFETALAELKKGCDKAESSSSEEQLSEYEYYKATTNNNEEAEAQVIECESTSDLDYESEDANDWSLNQYFKYTDDNQKKFNENTRYVADSSEEEMNSEEADMMANQQANNYFESWKDRLLQEVALEEEAQRAQQELDEKQKQDELNKKLYDARQQLIRLRKKSDPK